MVAEPTRHMFIQSGLLALGCVALTSCSHRFSASRTPRIGFLIGDIPIFVAAFDAELQRLGWVNGKNIIVETRLSRRNSDDLEVQAAELARMDLDLIVAASLPQSLAVRRFNPLMPMVVGTAPGFISNGFANSLERPGGHVTGMDELPPGLTAKRLKLLKAAVPSASQIALLSTTPGSGGHEMQLADAQMGAAELGVRVRPYRATSLPQLEQALSQISADRMNGMISFQGALALQNAPLIASFAAREGIPAIYQSKLFVEAGGLMSLAPDQVEQFREAARYVDKILRGASPGNLPIQHPERYFLTLNEAAATALGLSLSATFRAQVDETVNAF